MNDIEVTNGGQSEESAKRVEIQDGREQPAVIDTRALVITPGTNGTLFFLRTPFLNLRVKDPARLERHELVYVV